MKLLKLILCISLTIGGTDVTEAKSRKEVKASQTILLYPEGQNIDQGLPEAQGPLVSNGYTADQKPTDRFPAVN